jgi:hypothetical protein
MQLDAERPGRGLDLGGVVRAGGMIVCASPALRRGWVEQLQWSRGQGGVGDLPALGGGEALLDHGQVVDPLGRGAVWAALAGSGGGGMDVAAELERDRRSHGALLVADLDVAQVEGSKTSSTVAPTRAGSTW